ncbi:MAG: hypothetical protein IPN10_00235 [Saprospiraceae bacterium]|nr:hypothetical protein [Saprospiraceae bacterium]
MEHNAYTTLELFGDTASAIRLLDPMVWIKVQLDPLFVDVYKPLPVEA